MLHESRLSCMERTSLTRIPSAPLKLTQPRIIMTHLPSDRHIHMTNTVLTSGFPGCNVSVGVLHAVRVAVAIADDSEAREQVLAVSGRDGAGAARRCAAGGELVPAPRPLGAVRAPA